MTSISDLIVVISLLIVRVKTQANDNNMEATRNYINVTAATLTTEAIPECGNTQKMVHECFKYLPAPLMDFLQNSKIAISKQEINAKCNVFNRGMKCFDDYSARCLSNKEQNMFRNNVEGARRFFIKFCGDSDFQRDYLRHKDCFTFIQEDWMRCTKDFQNILTEELHGDKKNATDKFLEFCCARYAYENCIYNSARYKCYKHSAKFARDTAKMLSDEKHFSNCKQYENALCEANLSTWRRSSWHYLMLLLLFMKELMRQQFIRLP